jgi:hypothetical protein
MADPTKAETEQVFKILKAQKGNKVRQSYTEGLISEVDNVHRLALIAKLETLHGPASRMVSTFAWNARAYIGIWASTSASSGEFAVLSDNDPES